MVQIVRRLSKFPAGIKMFRNGTWLLWCMAIPCVLHIILFSYVPLFGWVWAFFKYKPGVTLERAQFLGISNFVKLFTDKNMLPFLRNTFIFAGLGLLTSPLPVIFAIFVSEFRSPRFQKCIQTVTTFPNFISWIIIYSLALSLFSVDDGLLNKILLDLGLIDERLNLLIEKNLVWFIQTGFGIWKGLGFSSIVYFAAIAGIDTELFDAASVDGAGRFQKIWYIKVPGTLPTFIVLFILSIGNILNTNFEQLYAFYNTLVDSTITTIDLYVYKIGMERGDYSMSTAVSISKTVVSIGLLTLANLLAKKVRGESIL